MIIKILIERPITVTHYKDDSLFGVQVRISEELNFYNIKFVPNRLIPEHRSFCFNTSESLKTQQVCIKNIEYHRIILTTIVVNGKIDILDYLIDNGLNTQCLLYPDLILGIIEHGTVNTLRYLLQKKYITIDALKKMGYSIWSRVIKNNRDDFKEFFQELNLDLQNIKEPDYIVKIKQRIAKIQLGNN